LTVQDAQLERVKAEIRAEADLARARAPQPRRDPPPRRKTPSQADPVAADRERIEYGIAELVGPQYVAFVEQAYRAILKREADEAGRNAQIALLANGTSKAEILGNLRWSPEGRAAGTHIKGLLPRYLLAKIGRIPLLGYLADWAIAFAALPKLMRHQRATDTSIGAVALANRTTDARLDAARSELEGRLAAVAQDVSALQRAVQDLERRAGEIEPRARRLELRADALEDHARESDARHDAQLQRADRLAQRADELTHYVHTGNHWLVSVQRGMDEVERVAGDLRDRAERLAAAIVEPGDMRTDRAERHAAWARDVAMRVGAGRRVLDLGSGDGDWLDALARVGIDATGVEPVTALADQAAARGRTVAAGDPLDVLARSADGGIDAISLSAAALGGEPVRIAQVVVEASRALAPGGRVFLRCEAEPRRVAADMPDAARWRAWFEAGGFRFLDSLQDGPASLTVLARAAE